MYITKLICYFLDDQNTAAKLKIDLSKGILSDSSRLWQNNIDETVRYVPQANKVQV
jgi:hypothetical protein